MGRLLRALLIEDDLADAQRIVAELTKGGFETFHERVDRRETLDTALSTRSWDVIISDYSMPEFTALEAMLTLKASGHDIPFILVSGAVGEEMAVLLMRAAPATTL